MRFLWFFFQVTWQSLFLALIFSWLCRLQLRRSYLFSLSNAVFFFYFLPFLLALLFYSVSVYYFDSLHLPFSVTFFHDSLVCLSFVLFTICLLFWFTSLSFFCCFNFFFSCLSRSSFLDFLSIPIHFIFFPKYLYYLVPITFTVAYIHVVILISPFKDVRLLQSETTKVGGTRPEVCNFIKKETLARMFSCEFCEISKNTFFT